MLEEMLEELKRILEDEDIPGKERRVELEKFYVRYCLYKFGGHRTKTAKYSGWSDRGLRSVLNKYPDIKEEFPTFKDEVSSFYQMLSQDDYPWTMQKKPRYTKLKAEMLEAKRRKEMEEM